MAHSYFDNKDKKPDAEGLKKVLGGCYTVWNTIYDYVYLKYPEAFEEWSFGGAKYGWNYRLKDKKRAIVYLTPRENYLVVALVYGEKATNMALLATISEAIKDIIKTAPVYAEGRGFRIEVKDNKSVEDIKKLIDIKLMK